MHKKFNLYRNFWKLRYTIKIKDCQIKVYNCKKEQADFYSRVKGFTENIIIFDGVTITKSNILNLTTDIPTFVNQLNTELAVCVGSGSGGSVLPPGTILPSSLEEYSTDNIELSAQTADINNSGVFNLKTFYMLGNNTSANFYAPMNYHRTTNNNHRPQRQMSRQRAWVNGRFYARTVLVKNGKVIEYSAWSKALITKPNDVEYSVNAMKTINPKSYAPINIKAFIEH